MKGVVGFSLINFQMLMVIGFFILCKVFSFFFSLTWDLGFACSELVVLWF